MQPYGCRIAAYTKNPSDFADCRSRIFKDFCDRVCLYEWRMEMPLRGEITMKRVGIYLRVSTNGQTTENQRRELAAVAARSGWQVAGFYEDAGISGAKGRDRRPAFDQLLKDATARKVNMIAAWSVDRLGHSLQDLTAPGAPGIEMRPLSASTGDRHHDAVRPRHVSNVRRVRRV